MGASRKPVNSSLRDRATVPHALPTTAMLLTAVLLQGCAATQDLFQQAGKEAEDGNYLTALYMGTLGATVGVAADILTLGTIEKSNTAPPVAAPARSDYPPQMRQTVAQQAAPASPPQTTAAAAAPLAPPPKAPGGIFGLGGPNSLTSTCLREETVAVTQELANKWVGYIPSPQYGFRGEAIMITNICQQRVVVYTASCLDKYAGTSGRNSYESWSAGEQMGIFAEFYGFLSLSPGMKFPVAHRGETHHRQPSSTSPSYVRTVIGEVVYGAWDPDFPKDVAPIFGRAMVAVHKRLNKVIRGVESEIRPTHSIGGNPASWRRLPTLPNPPPTCAAVDMKSTWLAFAK